MPTPSEPLDGAPVGLAGAAVPEPSELGCPALPPGAGWFAGVAKAGGPMGSALSSSSPPEQAVSPSVSEPTQTMCVERNLSFMRKPRLADLYPMPIAPDAEIASSCRRCPGRKTPTEFSSFRPKGNHCDLSRLRFVQST